MSAEIERAAVDYDRAQAIGHPLACIDARKRLDAARRTAMTSQLIERLEATRPSMEVRPVAGGYDYVESKHRTLINPDGPEAATTIARLVEALRDIASVDRPFVDANGADGAFEKIIARAQEALTAYRGRVG